MDARNPAAFLFLACLLLSSAPNPAMAGQLFDEAWISSHHGAHPLVGRIWSPHRASFISHDDLRHRLSGAEFVLVGETHDNPDHHRIQAAIISHLAQTGRRPRIALEMVPRARQNVLDRFKKDHSVDSAALGDMLEWNDSGWPAWAIYRPIAEAARRHDLAMRAGGVAPARLHRMAAGDKDPRLSTLRSRWRLDRPLAPAVEAALIDELYEAHCQAMPRSSLGHMLPIQRLRDAVMAEALSEPPAASAVLIAGNGHVRRDWAVPALLGERFPSKTLLTIALIETYRDRIGPHEYLPPSATSQVVYDIMIFTPRHSIIDHCARLRERLKKKKTRGLRPIPFRQRKLAAMLVPDWTLPDPTLVTNVHFSSRPYQPL